MVKIKDFTLASKNLGEHVPPVPYTPPAHDCYINTNRKILKVI